VDWKRIEVHPLWKGLFPRKLTSHVHGFYFLLTVRLDRFFIEGTFRSLGEFLNVNSSLFLGSHWPDFNCMLLLTVFENVSRKFNFYYNPTKIMGSSHEDVCTFLIIPRFILLIVRNVSDKKKLAEKIKIHVLGCVTCLRKSCRL
jgi:hypothetical protein